VKTQIQKWGNSLALRIPRSFALESNVEQGTVVDVTLDNGKIVVSPIVEPELSLSDLLAQVTKRNLHGETSSGKPVGREIW
jgi:antitoxin MazE